MNTYVKQKKWQIVMSEDPFLLRDLKCYEWIGLFYLIIRDYLHLCRK